MDWGLHSILLLIFLLYGASAQFDCKDYATSPKKWECKGPQNNTDLANIFCGLEANSYLFCQFKATLNGGKWDVNPSDVHVAVGVSKVRTDEQCIDEKKAMEAVYATCKDENCNLTTEEVLKSCQVSYAKCSEKYLELKESISDINTRGATVACTWKYKNEPGQWTKQESKPEIVKSDIFKNGPFICSHSAKTQMVTVFCHDEMDGHAGNCDKALDDKFSSDKPYFESNCKIPTTATSDLNATTIQMAGAADENFLQQNKMAIGIGCGVVGIVIIALVALFIYKKVTGKKFKDLFAKRPKKAEKKDKTKKKKDDNQSTTDKTEDPKSAMEDSAGTTDRYVNELLQPKKPETNP